MNFPREIPRRLTPNEEARFWAKVQKGKEKDCWIWTAAKQQGYGVFRFAGYGWRAHRIAFFLLNGRNPEGETLDHQCNNPSCVNPRHLKEMSFKENLAKNGSPPSVNARKTHCDHGHIYTEENTYVDPRGKRQCRTCMRERDRKRYEQRYESYKNKKTNDSVMRDFAAEPKLSAQDLNDIISRHNDGQSIRSLALEYKVSPAAIRYHLKKRLV